MKKAEEKKNIFWTSGMDSTFRLIQLLTTTNFLIQPHYIIRYEDSTGIEIDTMIRIRRVVSIKFPEVMIRFLPTVYINEGLIPKFKDIDKQIGELKKIGKVSEQYHVMSNYCKEFNIGQIEVALTSLSAEKEFFEYFKNSAAFKSFTYPTIELTKIDMFQIAKTNDWNDILNMTSFCRRPIKKISPCGVCGPCVDAVDSGMGFRLPLRSRIKAKLQMPLRRYWRNNYLKHNDKRFFKFVKQKLESRL